MKNFNTAELEALALKAINEYTLVFINEITAYLPCSRATFYNHGLDKIDLIKDGLFQNRVNLKTEIRKRLLESSSAAGLIALYKLIATEEELKRLQNRYVNVGQTNEQNQDFENLLRRYSRENSEDCEQGENSEDHV